MTKKKAVAKKKRTSSTRKPVARTASPLPKVPLDAMPPARQRAVFRAVEKTLRDARVVGVLEALQFETQANTLICPPGMARRMTCRKEANGGVRCEPECVSLPHP